MAIENYSDRQERGTEFSGVPTPNTVQPKSASALTAWEKLRLGYKTGQEVDAEAPATSRSWEGLAESPNSVFDEA